LEAGIEGSLHAVWEVWKDDDFVRDQPRQNDPFMPFAARMEEAKHPSWDMFTPEEQASLERHSLDAEGVTLVDASNGFNELNRYAMLWNVRHRWPKGSRLAFNSYRHFNICIVRKGTGAPAFMIFGDKRV
jgi:hypothetical protein